MKQVFLTILLIVTLLISNVSAAVAASGTYAISSATSGSLQAADPTVVSSVNFDDSTTGTWTQSGNPTLGYADDGNGGQALSITRAADYEGIQSPTGLLEPGVVYTFSMRARLPADSAVTSTDVRFVVKPNFNWVANTTINATDWTTITGTYTLPDGVDPAESQIYIGSSDQSGPYTILIDDILITRPAADPTVVSSVNFDDSTTGTWTQSGSPTLGYVDDGNGGQALSITRAADYEGIQSPIGLLEAAVEYTFSMRARLPADSAVTSTDVRFVVKPNFNWVANTTINATDWTTVTGIYMLPDGVDPAESQIYIGSSDQTGPYTILIDDILITALDSGGGGGGTVVIDTDFENGLDGWVLREADSTPATLLLTETESHSPTHAALVTDRDGQGDGIGRDVTGLMKPGTTYNITAWVKFAAGSPADTLWLSMRRTTAGTDTYDTVGQFANTPGDSWRQVTATYQMGAAEQAFLYFETTWPDGTSAPFLVDDIKVEEQSGGAVCDEELTPLKSTVDFPTGVAIDSRETTGAYACTVLHHFDQITPENHMKPEAWYDANRNFQINPEAKLLMDFAQANNLRVYGHTLLWHQQTPDWFFQRNDGTPLTNSPADQEILRTRLHDHIFDVAQTLSDMYGAFGSATNPLVAFDVVNEVISDSATSDGLRTSPYYNILGPSYIDDAFNWADEAFNVTYADAGATRPVALVINDYNTDQADKRARFYNLVADLLSRDIPVDIVGHQFHVSLTSPIQSLDDALTAFEDLPVKQAVTELDVLTGTPVDNAKLIEQGYYYRDAFRIFRAHTANIYSVTVWGLYDARSWRSTNAPLLFNDQLAAKPAYFGAVDQPLPARIRTALVFQADVPLEAGATSSLEWQKLRLINVGDKFSFQLRWEPDHLSVFVDAQDATPQAADKLTFQVGNNTYTFNRDATGDVPGVVEEVSGGWKAVIHLPLSSAAQDDQVQFDVALTDGADTVGWNDPGAVGTLTLAEPLSYLEVAGIGNGNAPTIDGNIDPVWALANTVSTDKQIAGSNTATADVKTLWKGNTLYVLAHVHDPILDDTASDPWQKDSVEIYVDAGNYKNGAYRPEDTQIRINYKNETSFGTGDTAAQQARLVSATQVVDDGYIVEASISLLDEGGVGTFHGLDFQVNDAANGARIGIRNWADPTNAGYLSTSHWGVGRLLEADQTVPELHLTTPIDLTATAEDGYHGLTASAAGVTATDAFDEPSWLVITSDAPQVLPIGSNVVTWTVTDLSGNTATEQQTILVHARVLTSLTYSGSKRVVINPRPGSFTPGAVLSAPVAACVPGQPVYFTLDRNPMTGEAVTIVLGTATTNADGKVKLTVATSGWRAGTYTLAAIYDGNNLGCVGSSTSVTLTVVVVPPTNPPGAANP